MFVDLGYGFDARTTLESASRFRQFNSELKILGVEIDKERVEAALPFADEKTYFRLGGFNLPLKDDEHVRLIRAFNVLRQYEEKDFVRLRATGGVCSAWRLDDGRDIESIWEYLVRKFGEEGFGAGQLIARYSGTRSRTP